MAHDTPRMESPLQATLAGIRDRFGSGPRLTLSDDERLDGQQVLITGGNRGLGFGIATRLTQRGATVWLACRSSGDAAVTALRQNSPSSPVEALDLDLAQPASIQALVRELQARGVRLDRVVLNAAVVPLGSRQTASGLDVMFHVNFLANVDLFDRLRDSCVLAERDARLIVVSSEAHRSGNPTLADFGIPGEYGTSGVMPHYGQSKLFLTTWAMHLARTTPPAELGVFVVGPGAVASDIAREAPAWMRVWLTPTMKLLFQSPYTAAAPVEWTACTTALAGQTGLYHHMHRRKDPHPFALNSQAGADLYAHATTLLEQLR